MTRKRKGMIIKNSNTSPVTIKLATRTLVVQPSEEVPITAEEVRDPVLRENLQVRSISIVRPSTEEEEAALRGRLEQGEGAAH